MSEQSGSFCSKGQEAHAEAVRPEEFSMLREGSRLEDNRIAKVRLSPPLEGRG